jgi:PKHD-type hydroxylase
MLVHIANVLDAATLEEVTAAIRTLEFEDGAATAGWHARVVKNNRQAKPSRELARVQQVLVEALLAHSVFRSLTLPDRISPPLISRTGVGQGYGTHVDDALMGRDGARIRTDISVTIFLNNSKEYDGGELVAESIAGEDAAKFEAGDAVVYPSTTLHRVESVTRGERIVAAAWVQSLVRDLEVREVLFDLDRARRMIFDRDGKSEAFDLISKSYSNVLRRFAGA